MLLGLIVLAALAYWLWWYERFHAPIPHADLVNTWVAQSPTLAQGVAALNAGDYQSSITQLNQSLASATDPLVKIQDNILLGQAYQRQGDYQKAITYYAAVEPINVPRSARARASAVQWMADLHQVFQDPGVTAAIFAIPMYKPMQVPGDDALSYRHLYEHAVMIYPIAESEYQIAQWYAQKLLRSKSAASNSPDALNDQQKSQYMSAIKDAFSAAEPDVAYLGTDPSFASQLNSTLLRKAIVLALLNLYGDTSLGNAEDVFKQITATPADKVTPPGGDGIARYRYALFLIQKFGITRSADVTAILQPIDSESVDYTHSALANFLMSVEKNSTSTQIPTVLSVANADPGFKAFLKKLGWTASDLTAPAHAASQGTATN